MDSPPRLALRSLLPNQAEKHVTLNEGLQAFDVMTSLSVHSRAMPSEPAAAMPMTTLVNA